MKWKVAVVASVGLFISPWPGVALDAEKQAIIDRYKQPFTIYFAAIEQLDKALGAADSEGEFVRAADKFCEEVNRFVDQFNSNSEAFQAAGADKVLNDDPDSKKALTDFVEELKKKLADVQPTFQALQMGFKKYGNSEEMSRVRNRTVATLNRVQLLTM
jgi:hypothetical protein